jgi:hypothetical protein
VDATVDSVQSALSEVSGRATARFILVEVHNGNISTSWPMVMMSSVTVRIASFATDCNWLTYGQEMLTWTQLNSQAVTSAVLGLGYVPLPLSYKRYRFGLISI